MSDRFNYFQNVTVSDTDYPTNPDANFGFHSKGFSLTNQGSATITYSFDGTNDHGNLASSGVTIDRVFQDRMVNKIWFKVASGSHSVRIEAWGSSGR